MNVSVCVIFRNSENTLPELIRSFQYLPDSTYNFEFVFVDNNSTDQSADVIKKSGLNDFKIISRDKNSLAEARNQAIQNSQYEYIYFIDSDCSLNPNTWDELLRNWDPSAYDGWGGSQIFPSSIPFLKILDQMRYHYLGHFGSAQMKLGKNTIQVDHLSTTHVLYKKDLLAQLGGFNSHLTSSAEDLELSLRIHRGGFKLQFLPSSQVNHIICENIGGWLKKAWRNGLWQTRLVSINTSIMGTRRFWPPIILLALLLLMPKLFLFLTTVYLVTLIIISFSNARLTNEERLQLFILYSATHGIYFVSGLVGVILACQDLILSRFTPRTTAN